MGKSSDRTCTRGTRTHFRPVIARTGLPAQPSRISPGSSSSRAGAARCKLFSASGVSLSNVLPTFEHMGAKVVDERPYEISPRDRPTVWIYDFSLEVAAPNVERVREIFQEAFLGIWRGEFEDDGLGGLVLAAGLTGREITVIR